MKILYLTLCICVLDVTHGWRINPFCRNKKVDRNHFGFDYFGPSKQKERQLNKDHRNIDASIKKALDCGAECFINRRGSGNAFRRCPNTDSGTRRSLKNGPFLSKRVVGGVRKCSDHEIVCSRLVYEQTRHSPPSCALPVPYSEPKCEQRKTERLWVRHQGKFCKVVKGSSEPILNIATCSYKRCRSTPYGAIQRCKPNSWIKIVFCVYCPGGSGAPNSDPNGVMDIKHMYIPTSCTCNTEWCENVGW